MAPRGIVAVAVASLFAIELEDAGFAGSEQLVNITFTVVVGTVLFYSLAAPPLAKMLGITQEQPQGTLIVGAHHWARQIASAIQDAGFDVWMVDTNGRHIVNATFAGLTGFQDSIMADGILDDLPMECTGRMLALTDNSELNALAAVRFSQWLGSDNVYQLPPAKAGVSQSITEQMRGRILFRRDMIFSELEQNYYRGAQVVLVKKNAADTLASYLERGKLALLLFVVTTDGRLLVSTADSPLTPDANQAAILLLEKDLNEQPSSSSMDASTAATT